GGGGIIVAVLVILALAVGLLAGLLLAQYLPGVPGAAEDTAPDTSAPDDSAPVQGGASGAEIADAVLLSTVFIQILGAGEAFSGSGFVYNDAGYIVTNAHVVEPALQNGGEVVVVFSDGAEEEAEIVGSTSDYDLAVLRVDRT